MSEVGPTVGHMNPDSLLNLGLAVVCETCESEIEVLDDAADHGVCRHCGVAFLLDADLLVLSEPLRPTLSA